MFRKIIFINFSLVLFFVLALASEQVQSKDVSTYESAEPVAYIGHGAMFDENGTEIQVTVEFIEEAQRFYLNTLFNRADEQLRALFEQKQDRLFIGQQWDKHSELYAKLALTKWLLYEVNPADIGTLYGKLNLLQQKLISFELLIDPSESGDLVELFELPIVLKELLIAEGLAGSNTNNISSYDSPILGGADYIDQCSAAGVPIPPDWGTSQWESKGALTNAQQFIGGTTVAEIYTYKSNAPEGVCFALPRSVGNTIQALGIICLGKTSSNACFWDNQQDADGNGSFEKSFPIPKGMIVSISRFAGGADLATLNTGGICTDCHAGENPFVIHPYTPLGPPDLAGLPQVYSLS
jgi:hypothetical protein